MKEKIISLGFDPANTTGWACIGKREEKLEIMATGIIELKSKETLGKKLLKFKKEVREIIGLWKPWIISCEQMNYTRNLATVRNLASYQAILAIEAERKGLELNFIGVTEVRKAIGLKGNATKEEVAKFLKKMFKNDPDVDWNNYNITDAIAVAVAVMKE